MESIRSFLCKGWAMVVLMACTVLAYRELADIPGNTRQFIATVNNNCGDFKEVLRRCHVWKDMGFCFKYRRQMQHVCNKTCQYCVPGQKQWRVIDIKGVWGQLKEPVSAHVSSTKVPKQPPVQILGKETTPQVEDAARAIATQLEGEIDHNELSAPPNAGGQLDEARIGVQSAMVPTNGETKGKMSFSLNVSSAEQEQKTHPQDGPTISGKTQVGEKPDKGTNPIVLLMGYGLGEKSSQRVYDDLNNATDFPASDGETKNNVGPHDAPIHGKLLAFRDNSTSLTEAAQERKSPSSRFRTEDNVPESDLKEIVELLDNAASVNGRLQPVAVNQYMHEETNEGNADSNALQLNLGAQSLDSQEMSTLQSKVTHRGGVKNTHSILPISSDDTTNQKAFEQIAVHVLPNTSEVNSTSMVENFVKLNRSEGSMPTDSMVAGNKHGNINNPLQMNPSFRSKPRVSKPSGKQVTLTINERPGAGEAVFKVKNSPTATGVSYTTEDHPEGLPSPTYLLQSENEEARAKADEEEAKIRAATSAIKNVIKLFDKGHSHHGHTRLIQEPTQDFPADSKSLEDGPELIAGMDASEYNAEVAQAQNLDRARASALALSQQNGPYRSPGEASPGSPPPNYAVVGMSDSKDWKSLAHTLATQLKHVLNHMEDREKENRHEKQKIQEQMMLMAQQQMTGIGREDDEGPAADDDDDDDYDDEMRNRDEMEKRRHSVSSPQERTEVGNTPRNSRLTDQKFYHEKLRRKLNGLQLAHKAVNSLSRLEIRHKSNKQKRRLT